MEYYTSQYKPFNGIVIQTWLEFKSNITGLLQTSVSHFFCSHESCNGGGDPPTHTYVRLHKPEMSHSLKYPSFIHCVFKI